MSEWISVKDRLPEHDELCLVIVSGKPQKNISLHDAYELAEYTPEGWIIEMWPELEDADVSYWMPLPEPPMTKVSSNNVQKCSFGDGIRILPDGVHELDPCVYEEIERYRNATVIVSQCKKCGTIDISWERQENTRKVTDDDIYCE